MHNDEKTNSSVANMHTCEFYIAVTTPSPSFSNELFLFLSHSLSKQDVYVSVGLPETDQYKADDQIAGL